MIVKCRKNLGRHLRQLRHERRCCRFVREYCSLQSAILAESRSKMLLRALRGGALAKKANNQETPGDNCDSCDKRLDVFGLF